MCKEVPVTVESAASSWETEAAPHLYRETLIVMPQLCQ